MAGHPGPSPSAEIGIDEIEIGELLQTIKRGWKLIVLCVAGCLLLGLFYLHVATYRYAITMQVTPASGGSTMGMSGKLGSLAEMAGVNLPTNPGQLSFDLYIEGLTSRQAATLLSKDKALMQHIFASEWNPDLERWVEPTGVVPSLKKLVRTIIGAPSLKWSPPDAGRLQLYLGKTIDIAKDKESPIVVISLLNSDPVMGSQLMKQLHEEVDSYLRERMVVRASTYVAYLQDKIARTNVQEYRIALANALAEQEKMKMMASSSLPFAAEPFGDPEATIKPVSPNAVLVLAIALFAGFGVGILLAFIIGYRNQVSSVDVDENGVA